MDQSTHRKPTPPARALFLPIVANPISTSSVCAFCGGRTVVRPHGTTYCCKRAEVSTLHGLVDRIEERLNDELRDPALDDHARLALGHLLRTIRSVKKL